MRDVFTRSQNYCQVSHFVNSATIANMRKLGFVVAVAFLLAACGGDAAKPKTTYEVLEAQTMALPCSETDPEVKRYLITKSRTQLGAVTASACGYPDSEYGPITVLAISKQGSATPGEYAKARSFGLVNGLVGTTSSLPLGWGE